MGAVTELLRAAKRGNQNAAQQIVGLVYDELKRLAARQMRHQRADHTLQPTALVNEVYLRLAGSDIAWSDRRHFIAAAARAMRQVLVDHARRRRTDKRGHGRARVTLGGGLQVAAEGYDAIVVDQALAALEREEPRIVRLIELRVFAGLSVEECAELMQLSRATINRDWVYAKAWLVDRLQSSE